MQGLIDRNVYTPEMASKIESMGTYAITVANRWLLGWPTLVAKHIKLQTYVEALQNQVELETDILAEATDMKHLAHHEILELHQIAAAPPATAT